ncbi:MAG: DUF3307 domain-containing protein [Erysipelotrichaceae bacterium]|nr:DUF3307 domain-containing protein [Erysipelotrichaceae bacterium]
MVNFTFMTALHLVGDFYLQPSETSFAHNTRKLVFFRTFRYLVAFIPILFYTPLEICIQVYAILASIHVLTDKLSIHTNGKQKKTILFLFCQTARILAILFVSRRISPCSFFTHHIFIMKTILAVLLMGMPGSVFIRYLFTDVFLSEEPSGFFDVGSMIGVMERLLSLIMAGFSNLSAIALIITVKTWARAEDIKSNVGDFKHKYLLGTLASLVYALTVYAICFRL